MCKKCNFDLFGTWPDTNTCTECGSQLDSPNRIIKGEYKKRPIIIGLAIVVLLPSLIWQGYHVYHWIQTHSWYAYIPTIVLMGEVDSNNTKLIRQNLALSELGRRISLNRLSDQRLEQLIKTGLAAQSDINTPWQAGWGDVIQAAWLAGKLNERDQADYSRNSCDISMVVFPLPVTQSESLTIGYKTTALRVGNNLSLGLSGRPVEILLDNNDNNHNNRIISAAEIQTGVITAYGNFTPTMLLADIPMQNVEPGMHTITVTWKLTLLDGPDPTTKMPWWTITTSMKFKVLAQNN